MTKLRWSPIRVLSTLSAKAMRMQTRGFALIVGLFVALLVTALGASWMAIEVVNETRAYAAGESRYSRAQKMAVLDLHRYVVSGRPADYREFEADIAVPLGDHAARLAMQRSPFDRDAAVRGLLQGQNHPADIPGLIQLYRRFFWWQPFAEAVDDWRTADAGIAELMADAQRLKARMARGPLDHAARHPILTGIDATDRRITAREITFSSHMGDAARSATWLVIIVLCATTVILWAIGIFFATRLFRRQLVLDRQLAASERRFRDYAEVASDWYWEMNAESRIIYMSERIYEIMDIPHGTAIDFDGIKMIRDTALDPVHRDEVLAAIAEHRPFRGLSMHFRARGGGQGYAAISGKPRYDSTGSFAGFRGVGEDVTAQIRDAHSLRDAKQRAEAANRAKSEFLANMSHELRTPLNAILGFSDIIRQRLFGDDAVERYANYAGDIHGAGSHLLGIINDILDLSKIEAGRVVLDERDCALDSIVEDARTLVGDRWRGIDFRIELPRPPLRLRLDDRKFAQVLVNLLSNAFKFTPQGGHVTLGAQLQSDGSAAITVKDTGIGIAEEDIETVLSPFGQVESAFSRRHHGTGLGLPLAKSLIELHGGTLRLESTEGTGTTVTILLPAARVLGSPSAARA
jgi:signal transduction histidine kinase